MSDHDRFRDSGARLSEFTDVVDVRCPACSGHAMVMMVPEREIARVTCAGCGYSRTTGTTIRLDPKHGVTDPYFGLELWLQTPFRGEVLWAYNTRHAQFLAEYVGATRRDREPNKNASLASRLPAWMKSGANRDALLAALRKLESRP